MGTEVLIIPEEKLGEVIKVIRAGLTCVNEGFYINQISDETNEQLTKWCDEYEEYGIRVGLIGQGEKK